MASPQDLERMRRDAELLISTVARTGRAVPQDAAPAPAPPPQASTLPPAPQPVHVTPQHSTKGRKLTAEEELAALAGEAERPAASAEGLFAKVAQMAQEAESATPAPIPMQDRPAQASPPVTHHKRVDTPTVTPMHVKKGKDEKKAKDEAMRLAAKEKRVKQSLTRQDTPMPSTLSSAVAGAIAAHHAAANEDPAAREEERMLRAINKHIRTRSHEDGAPSSPPVSDSKLDQHPTSTTTPPASPSPASTAASPAVADLPAKPDIASPSISAPADTSSTGTQSNPNGTSHVASENSHSTPSSAPSPIAISSPVAVPRPVSPPKEIVAPTPPSPSANYDAGANATPAAGASTPGASQPIAIPSKSLAVVVEEDVVVTLTPPRASLDPFSLSAAETERQKEEVERNQALIYEMLGVKKEDKDEKDDSTPIEEPKSPAALLEDLTAALKQEDDDKKKAEEKQRAEAAAAAAAPPLPAVLTRQDTPLPGVIQRVSEEAKKERDEEEKLREEEEKNLPPVHSRPGEGPRARPPSDTVSPRQLPKKEDGRAEKLRHMMESAQKKEESKSSHPPEESPNGTAAHANSPPTNNDHKEPVAAPRSPVAEKKPEEAKPEHSEGDAQKSDQSATAPPLAEIKAGSESDLDALLSNDSAAQRAREQREMAAIEEEERRMKELEDALAAQEAEHAADVEKRHKEDAERKVKEEKRKEAEEARIREKEKEETERIDKSNSNKAKDDDEEQSAANEAIAELDDLLTRAEAQQQKEANREREKDKERDNGRLNAIIGNAGAVSADSDELFEVEVPTEAPEETGPKEESVEVLEELLTAKATVAEFQVVSAPGPVPDKREPDLRFVANAAAKDKDSEETDDITEMEPPNAEEIDEISEAEMWTASGIVRRLKEQPASAPQSSRPQAVSPPPTINTDQALKAMRMRVKKIFDLFVPAGDEALSGSALEDFTDQIATHFADEVGDDSIEFGPYLDEEGALTFDGFLSWWRERQAQR